MGPFADYREFLKKDKKDNKLKWIDDEKDDKVLLRTNNSEDDLVLMDNPNKVTRHYEESDHVPSIIKPHLKRNVEKDLKVFGVAQPST